MRHLKLYKRSVGREFARKWMKIYGTETGIEGIVSQPDQSSQSSSPAKFDSIQKLLSSKHGQLRYRRLDDRKRHELANLYTGTLRDMFAEDDIMGGKGVLISKIEVPSVFNELLVYWQCYGDQQRDKEISTILDSHSLVVRNRLSEVLFGAKVPALKFIPDRKHLVEQEMNHLFKMADYGVPYQALSRTAATWGAILDDPPPKPEERKDDGRKNKIPDPDHVPPFVVRLLARIEAEKAAKKTTTSDQDEQTTSRTDERRDGYPNDGACT